MRIRWVTWCSKSLGPQSVSCHINVIHHSNMYENLRISICSGNVWSNYIWQLWSAVQPRFAWAVGWIAHRKIIDKCAFSWIFSVKMPLFIGCINVHPHWTHFRSKTMTATFPISHIFLVILPGPYCCQLSNENVDIHAGSGTLASSVTVSTGCGDLTCPWVLKADAGQQINISVIDFHYGKFYCVGFYSCYI